jgi:Protein of unknown function (DUF3313)
MKSRFLVSSFILALALCACAWSNSAKAQNAANEPAPVSNDGLQLKVHTGNRLVYVKPGATFGNFDKVMILDCFIQFEKNWQRNYNSNEPDLERQVSDENVLQMKQALAAEFKRVFAQELQNGGYQVVTAAAPDVLLLRPAIIDLVVTAPDLRAAGMDANFVSSAGSGTLYLELWDSATNTILARVMDAEADQQAFTRRADSVSNTAAADTIIKGWADSLTKHLEAVRKTAN